MRAFFHRATASSEQLCGPLCIVLGSPFEVQLLLSGLPIRDRYIMVFSSTLAFMPVRGAIALVWTLEPHCRVFKLLEESEYYLWFDWHTIRVRLVRACIRLFRK